LNWRLEKGVDVLTVTYLGKSSTLSGTYLAPLRIRLVHWIPLLLGLMWAFSPVGSQAALRIVSAQQETIITHLQDHVHYGYPVSTEATVGGDASGSINAANSIVITSLLSVSVTGSKPQDIWGNIKIPLLSNASQFSGSDGWIQIDAQNGTQYCSLLGMPFVKPQSNGNSTFLMRSWYWDLHDPKVTWFKVPQNISYLNETSPDLPSHLNVSSNYEFFTGTNGMWTLALAPNWPTVQNNNIQPNMSTAIVLAEWDYEPDDEDIEITRVEAVLSQNFVEVNISCTPTSCAANAIRPSVSIDSDFQRTADWSFFGEWMLHNLKGAFPLMHSGTPYLGIFERYLQNGTQNAFTSITEVTGVYLHEVPADTIALRLMHIVNSYWTASTFIGDVAGNFNSSDVVLNVNSTLNATATLSNHEEFMHCDKNWHAILCIATFVLFCAGSFSAVVTCVRISPDATDFVSALTRSDGSNKFDSGSYLDADKRVRLFKDMRLRIGDASANEDAGVIVISRAENADALKVGRLYT
jgi:hypothetical protein